MKHYHLHYQWFSIALLVLVLDHITKFLASHYLDYATPLAIVPFFNLTLLHNTGAAFSFLNDLGPWSNRFFIFITGFISLIIIGWLSRIPRGKIVLPLALSLMLGGALGNIVDRIMHGYVVDFLHFYVGDWHWPVFNLADTFISIGAFLLIIQTFWLED